MAKLALLLGGGIGYVLGTRAGRERYEQIEAQARRIWKDPRVQEKKAQAQAVANEKGSDLADRAAQAAPGSGKRSNSTGSSSTGSSSTGSSNSGSSSTGSSSTGSSSTGSSSSSTRPPGSSGSTGGSAS